MCDRFGVSPSGFYAWEKRDNKPQLDRDRELLTHIRRVHRGRRRCYGSPRVYRLLRRLGVECSRRRVARVMRDNGIQATVVGLYYYHPNRRTHYQRIDNHLGNAPAPTRINQQWAADFTYMKTRRNAWVYLATVMDLYSRKIIGWSVSSVKDVEFTQSSLSMAIRKRTPLAGAIFHTDQGSEYAAEKFQQALESAKLKASMSRKGRCTDNATAESFFHTFKTESFYQKQFTNKEEIEREFKSYIDFYNNDRLHSSLNYMSPNEYENQAA